MYSRHQRPDYQDGMPHIRGSASQYDERRRTYRGDDRDEDRRHTEMAERPRVVSTREDYRRHTETRERPRDRFAREETVYDHRRSTRANYTDPPRFRVGRERDRNFSRHRRGSPSPPPTDISSSDSEDVNAKNDISLASFDGSGAALVVDPTLHVSKQKQNLEAIISESDPAIDSPSLPEVALHADKGKTTYSVLSSRYIKELDSESSEDISVQVEYLSNPPFFRGRDRSIFRWIHFEHENMDFDAFSRCAQEMPGLPEDQVQGVSYFLQGIRKNMERTIPSQHSQHGAVGKFMKPGMMNKTGKRSFAFFCIPYFKLSPYSTSGSTANPRLHPMRTLLQIKYASTTKQREFEQAVCSLAGTPQDSVFHVPHLWCLIINNKFMLTSANSLSAQNLCGDRVTIKANIPTQPPTSFRFPQSIQVTIENRLYVLPLSQCESWFKFTQNFSKYTLTLHDQYNLTWKKVKITAELWPLIVRQVRTEIVCIEFSQRNRPINHGIEKYDIGGDLDDLASRPPIPEDRLSVISEGDSIRSGRSGRTTPESSPSKSASRSQKQPDDLQQSTTTPTNPKIHSSISENVPLETANLEEFHFMIWIAVRLGKRNTQSPGADIDKAVPTIQVNEETKPQSDRESVNAYLNSLHVWLENQKPKRASILYSKTPQKSLEDVDRSMKGMLKSQLDSPEIVQLKSDLVDSVKSVFVLFLPLGQRGVMCSKFWGALHMIITSAVPADDAWQLRDLIDTISAMGVKATTIKAQLSKSNSPPGDLNIPPEALRAWHSLLLCLMSWNPRQTRLAINYAEKSLRQLRKAHQDLMKNPKGKTIEQLEAILPNSLLAVIVGHIMTDLTGTLPDVVETYWECYAQLETKVLKEPLNRHHQAKITAFLGEIKIVLWALQIQQNTVVDIVDTEIAPLEEMDSFIRPRNPAMLILQETMYTLQGRILSMQELFDNAQMLLEYAADFKRQNKDKQEAAIYTFTIVTIIFLPMSTVATILGMNTTDVRNMEKTQWVFWATAIPVTAVVIIGSLFAAGILTWPFGRGVDRGQVRQDRTNSFIDFGSSASRDYDETKRRGRMAERKSGGRRRDSDESDIRTPSNGRESRIG